MGGVYLSEGKNGGSLLRGRKKWGEYTLAAKVRGIMSTPLLRVFLAPSLKAQITVYKLGGVYLGEENNGGSTHLRPSL